MSRIKNVGLSRRDIIRTGFAGTGLLAVGGVSAAGLLFGRNQSSVIETRYGAEPSEDFSKHFLDYVPTEGVLEFEDDQTVNFLTETFKTVESDVEYSWARIRSKGEVYSTKVPTSELEALDTEDLTTANDFEYTAVDPHGNRPHQKYDDFGTSTGRRLTVEPFEFSENIEHNGLVYQPETTSNFEAAEPYYRSLAWGIRSFRIPGSIGAAIFEVLSYDNNGNLVRNRYLVPSTFDHETLLRYTLEARLLWRDLLAILEANRRAGQAARATVYATAVAANRSIANGVKAVEGATTITKGIREAWPVLLALLLIDGGIILAQVVGLEAKIEEIMRILRRFPLVPDGAN